MRLIFDEIKADQSAAWLLRFGTMNVWIPKNEAVIFEEEKVIEMPRRVAFAKGIEEYQDRS